MSHLKRWTASRNRPSVGYRDCCSTSNPPLAGPGTQPFVAVVLCRTSGASSGRRRPYDASVWSDTSLTRLPDAHNDGDGRCRAKVGDHAHLVPLRDRDSRSDVYSVASQKPEGSHATLPVYSRSLDGMATPADWVPPFCP